MTHTHTIACSAGIPGGRLMCGDDALRAAAQAMVTALETGNPQSREWRRRIAYNIERLRAALASSRPEPLDVEPLARALHRRYGNQHLPPALDFDHPLDVCPDADYWRAEAFAIADADKG